MLKNNNNKTVATAKHSLPKARCQAVHLTVLSNTLQPSLTEADNHMLPREGK